MNSIKNRIILPMVIAVVLAAGLLAGCGGQTQQQVKTQSGIAGKYIAKQDMAEGLNQSFSASGTNIEIPGPIDAEFQLELKEDETFSLKVNAASLLESLRSALQNGGKDMIKNMLDEAGITEDMYDVLLEAGEYESVDEMIQGMLDEILAGLESGELQEIEETASLSGKYAVNGSRISLTAEAADETFTADEGTIQSDGTILIPVTFNGTKVEFSFKKG